MSKSEERMLPDSQADLTPLGERLRGRRKDLKMTLQDVADSAGFSVGFISQIERGITIPSLTSLIAVCRVLNLEASTFFAPLKVEGSFTRHNHRPVYALGRGGSDSVSYERLSAAFPGNVLRSTLIHEPPGYRTEPMSHEGEEIFFVLQGGLTIEVDGERMILEPGDSAHFSSIRTHTTWNHTTATTTVLHTCTMDVFGDGEPGGLPETSIAVTRAGKPPKTAPKTTTKKGNDA